MSLWNRCCFRRAKTWRILPGSPAASFLVEPVGLKVETMGRSTIVVVAGGGMRMAVRAVTA